MKFTRIYKLLITFFFLIVLGNQAVAECTLKMVYKEGGKEPLITAKPKHDGVYFDLFSEAAQRIGCTLEISRLPKKRLHGLLKEGKLDFYPGASFSKKRASYLYYLPNGLDTGEYGVTNTGIESLSSYQDLKAQNVTWLMEIGSSKNEKAKQLGIKIQERKHFDLDLVSKYIQRSTGQNYFYVADKELVDYFPKSTNQTLDEAGLVVHENCCGGNQPMYMGFSRFSLNFKEVPNPNYDESQPLSPDNFPTMIDKGSVAYKLSEALAAMKSEGLTDKIYNKWF